MFLPAMAYSILHPEIIEDFHEKLILQRCFKLAVIINRFDFMQDLHRTGCSLFCGEDALPNQVAILKETLKKFSRESF